MYQCSCLNLDGATLKKFDKKAIHKLLFYKCNNNKLTFILNNIRKICKAYNVFALEFNKNIYILKRPFKTFSFAVQFISKWKSSLIVKKKLLFGRKISKFYNEINFNKNISFYALPFEVDDEVIGFIGIENPGVKYENIKPLLSSYLIDLIELYIQEKNDIVNDSLYGYAKFEYGDNVKLLEANEGFFNLLQFTINEDIDYSKILFLNKKTLFSSLDHHFIYKHITDDHEIRFIYLSLLANCELQNQFVIHCLDITKVDYYYKNLFKDNNQFVEIENDYFSSLVGLKKDLTLANCDNKFYHIIKYSRDEFKQKFSNYLLNIISIDYHNRIINCINEAINKKVIKDCIIYLTDRFSKHIRVLVVINPFIKDDSYDFTLCITVVDQIGKNDIIYYDLVPGYIGKFLVGKRLKLLFANDNFFNFFEIDYENCNNYFYPPVYHEDVRLVDVNIEKMRKRMPISFDVRVKKKNGEICWTRIDGKCIDMQGEYPVYYIIFVDITQQRLLEIDLQSKLIKLKFATNDINQNFFEYDIINDVYSGKLYFDSILGYTNSFVTIKNYLNNLKAKAKYKEFTLWYDFLKGKYKEPFEFSVDDGNKIEYFTVIGKYIYDGKRLIKVIGKFVDCTLRKVKEQEVLEIFKYDSVTGIYNKEHGKYLIRERLETINSQSHLLLIDIDNFKLINENFGYMFGNMLLRDFGQLLNKQIGTDDVLYRSDSDEFIIFLNNKDLDYSTTLGNRICNLVKNLYLGEDEDIKLTCSVGITALSNKYDFDESLKKVASLVGRIKNSGISVYAYNDEDIDYFDTDLSRYENDFNFNQDDNIVLFALDILEKAHNIHAAINILLTRIGKQFNLSSIYIIDFEIEDLKGTVSHWWHGNQNTLFIPQKFNYQKDDLLEFISLYNINEMLDISYPMFQKFFNDYINHNFNNKIIFSCANYDMHKYVGSIFFEPQQENSIIKKNDKILLFKLSKVIFTHLKMKNVDHINKEQIYFLSKISHEIRTPLNSITLLTKLARGYANDNFYNYLDKVDASTKYLLSLVNNVLDFSRIESGKIKLNLENANLHEILDNIQLLMQVQAEEKKIKMNIMRKFNHQFVQCDVLRLNQVLINIIGNALKFTPEQGYVVIIVEETFDDNNFIAMKFSVRDSGVGISKDNLTRIFLPFEQEHLLTAKNYGGSGLGLTISYSLVKMMGGLLQVDSEVGKGSEFYFSIPFLKVNVSDNCENLIDSDYSKFKGKRILLVEDNELNADITKIILENMGFLVDVVYDGTSAINKFNIMDNNYYQVILMDIRMPGIDGLNATQIIRNLRKSDSSTIPIIAMTANAFDEEAKEAINLGINSYLTKPIDIITLYRELDKYI